MFSVVKELGFSIPVYRYRWRLDSYWERVWVMRMDKTGGLGVGIRDHFPYSHI